MKLSQEDFLALFSPLPSRTLQKSYPWGMGKEPFRAAVAKLTMVMVHCGYSALSGGTMTHPLGYQGCHSVQFGNHWFGIKWDRGGLEDGDSPEVGSNTPYSWLSQ